MDDRPELIVRAAVFTTEGDFDGIMAAVAEQADGSGFALHFLRGRDLDDRAESYVLTTNEGRTAHGCVQSWSRGPRHLDLDVSTEAALELCVPERFRLLLRADRISNERLLEGIVTILGPPRL